MKTVVFLFLLFVCSLFSNGQQPIVPTIMVSAPATAVPLSLPAAYPASSPSSYVRSWQMQKPLTDAQQVVTAAYTDALLQTQYFDGLGQPLQSVIRGASPTGKDLVTPIIYDAFGRESLRYLPYAADTTGGTFRLQPFREQSIFMQAQYGDQAERFFYAATEFEHSPLGRPLRSFAPGNSWVGSARGIQTAYQFNDSEEVRIWDIADTPGSLPYSHSFYAAGELARTAISDEEGRPSVEYKDKEGRVLLKKIQLEDTAAVCNHDGWLCTYYVYDCKGQLRFVLSPKAVEQVIASGSVSAAIADGLCFRYEYDEQGRMVIKKMPGAAEVRMVYDARDRLVFSQDGNMRKKNWWMATIYDALNRPVLTGMVVYTGSYASLAAYADDPAHLQGLSQLPLQGAVSAMLTLSFRETGRVSYQASAAIDFTDSFESESESDFVAEIITSSTSSSSYTLQGNPIPDCTDFKALTQNFYDDYSHSAKTYSTVDNGRLEAGSNRHADSIPSSASLATRGLPTGTRIWLMQDASDFSQGQWLESVPFYDEHARTIQIQSENEKDGIDLLSSRYDFSGKLLSTCVHHHNPQSTASELLVLTVMDYDPLGRLLSVRKKINDGSFQTIVRQEYDELGQLKTKHLGEGLQDLVYSYNIRGWLLGTNKEYVNSGTGGRFGQTLNYDFGFSRPQYSGNISGLCWRSIGDGEERAYGFNYDAANRLLRADFTQYTSGSWSATSGVDFSMKLGDGIHAASAYDANGNIRIMSQKGLLMQASDSIDQLTYTYFTNSNQLQNVVDKKDDPATVLGDFCTSVLHPQKAAKDEAANQSTNTDLSSIFDYTYDDNGNMTRDLNKDIAANDSADGIEYNYLNLPVQITVRKQGGIKGTIQYIYDALGQKHQKIVRELAIPVNFNGSIDTSDVIITTSYLGPFIYENRTYSHPGLAALNKPEQLQFFMQEEGRVRPTTDSTAPFVYDYFIKDHLGDVRMVLTDEKKVDKYPIASLESARAGIEGSYYKIDSNQVVSAGTIPGLPSYPNDNGMGTNPPDAAFETANSQKLYRLNGNVAKTGLGITLKVMAGDTVDIFGKSYYFQNNSGGNSVNQPTPVLDILAGLLGSPNSAIAATVHNSLTASSLNQLLPTTAGIVTLFDQQEQDSIAFATLPRASINYLLFDEQFRYVAGGFSKVGSNSVIKNHHSELQNIPVLRNGYLYIYCSNQSPVDVFFDNLQVVHTHGPLLEETHYYPFGLTMVGISSEALSFRSPSNKYKFNGYEKVDDLGINLYASLYRSFDPQLGRFWQSDPKPDEAVSLYTAMKNNPFKYSDPLGDTIIFTQAFLTTKFGQQLMNLYKHSSTFKKLLSRYDIGGGDGFWGEGAKGEFANNTNVVFDVFSKENTGGGQTAIQVQDKDGQWVDGGTVQSDKIDKNSKTRINIFVDPNSKETNTLGTFSNVVTHELTAHGVGFMSMSDVLHTTSGNDFVKFRTAGTYVFFKEPAKNNITTNGYYNPMVQHAILGLGLNGYYNAIRQEVNRSIKSGGLPNDVGKYRGEIDRVKAAFKNINQITQTEIYGP